MPGMDQLCGRRGGEAGQDEITCNPSIYQFNLSKMLPAAGSWEMLLFHMHLHIKKT